MWVSLIVNRYESIEGVTRKKSVFFSERKCKTLKTYGIRLQAQHWENWKTIKSLLLQALLAQSFAPLTL